MTDKPKTEDLVDEEVPAKSEKKKSIVKPQTDKRFAGRGVEKRK